MPRLKFFGLFRRYVSSHEMDIKAGSVREALNLAWADSPQLRAAMLESDELRPYVRVLVNGRHVELGQGLDTPLAADDEVAVFSPMAGG